jgi:SulP family sulfate permease
VPSQYGLFTAIIPNLIYPFIGTSKTLSPGPTALLSLLTATAVESMGPKSQEETIVYAIFLAIIVGGLQTLLGLFRLGFFVNFLSKPVLSGFTTASVILIIMSQIKHILGLSIPDAAVVQKILYYLGKAMFTPEMKGGDLGVHWPTFAFSLCCFTVYVALSYVFVPFRGTRYYLSKFIPIPLIMVVVSILSIYIVAVSTHAPPGSHVLGIKIVGTVPTGFPSPGIPMMPIYGNTTVNGTEIIGREMISPQTFVELVVIAIPVAIVAFAEGISVAKFYATKDRVQIDPSQELIASGLGCLLGGIFSGYPSTGALARSAINAGAGGVSQFVSLFTGIIMIFVVYFVTPLFYYLPKAFLGVLLILSVWKLIDIGTLRYTFQTRKRDFFVLVAAFLLTCFAGPQWGIIISVILSIALMIYRASRPRFVPLGRVPGSSIYRDLRTNAGVVIPGVLVVRFDSEMFFGNMSYLAEKLRTLRDKASLQLVGTVPNNTHVIVLDMSCVSQIDSSALLALKDIKATLDKDEILWLFAETRPSLMEVMRKGDVIVEEGSAQDGIPETNFFMEVHSAVLHGIEYAKMQAEKEANIEQRVVEDTQSQIELQDIQTDQTLDDTHTEQL